MGISLKQIISINKTFMQLINKNEYEKLVLELMNKSSKVFPNTYKKIEIQNNNQCDFIDVETNVTGYKKSNIIFSSCSIFDNNNSNILYIVKFSIGLLPLASTNSENSLILSKAIFNHFS